MKVLTATEMREVDRRTIEAGIPGVVLMENAAHRVIEFMSERFAPLSEQRIAVLCGKGNNGGDGLAIARQLYTRFHPRALHVILMDEPPETLPMLEACGCPVTREIPPEAPLCTLVVDALLGTGISGPAKGRMLEGIREINQGFPLAKVVAVDIPSGMPSDSAEPVGEFARADYTVTFTAPKVAHALPPNCDHVGELAVGAIGSPESLYAGVLRSLVEPAMFRTVLAPRPRGGHKGTFGHVLVAGGSEGKTGAAAMAGMAALRAGAGLVTVASERANLPPELMSGSLADVPALMAGKTVMAIGPGLGRTPAAESLVRHVLEQFPGPIVVDADALWPSRPHDGTRVLTPHPGEMARLTGKTTAEIQKDRLGCAQAYATENGVTLVLKGQRTVIGFPDGRVWINPTGTPALGTGGTGDTLTGFIAGLLAQFPNAPDEAVAAGVYLHGLAGEMAGPRLIATDLLTTFPLALEKCAHLSDRV